MTAIDAYVTELGAQLNVGRRRERVVLDEVRDHLMEAAEHRVHALGESRVKAEAAAATAFGPSGVIARRFNAAAGARSMRHSIIGGFLAGAGVVTAFLVAVVAQPPTPEPATVAMQVAYLAGVLAFQVAVAAGACAALRAAAIWRSSESSGLARAVVQRCAAVSMFALFSGALSVTVSMLMGAEQASQLNGIALALGVLAMLVVATVGLVMIVRLDVNAQDDIDDAVRGDAVASSIFVLMGESVTGFVNRRPVVSCAAATVVATMWAMSRAEATSITAALPWGIAEAVTVIAAFVLLGPTLGLRRSPHDTSPT